MYQQQGGNISRDCFRDKNLSLYSVCTSLGTICTSNKGKHFQRLLYREESISCEVRCSQIKIICTDSLNVIYVETYVYDDVYV